MPSIFLRTAATRVGTLNLDSRATFQILRRASVYDINAPSARCRGWQPPPLLRACRFLNRLASTYLLAWIFYMSRPDRDEFLRQTGSSSLLLPVSESFFRCALASFTIHSYAGS